MIHANQQNYLAWQARLKSSLLFRKWWQFWSNYAFIFFIPIFVWLSRQNNSYQTIGLCALSFFIARIVITTLINRWHPKTRPYQKYHFAPLTSMFFSFKTTIPNSFPSRHTTAYASVAFTIFYLFPAAGLILVGVTILTGAARVILGYHYPSDILAGLIIGASVGILVAWAGPLLFT